MSGLMRLPISDHVATLTLSLTVSEIRRLTIFLPNLKFENVPLALDL